MNAPSGPDLDDPLASLMRGFAFMASALQPMAASPQDTAAAVPGAGPGGSRPMPTVPAVLMQAQAAATAAVMRGLQRGAQSWADYGKASAGGGADIDVAQQHLRSVDEARAHLRRLAEIAADEARLLETQLRGLDEQLRATVEAPSPGAPRRRYARAKA